MRPIFNEKFVKKWYLWVHEQFTDALFMVEKSSFAADSKKKKNWNVHYSKGGRSKRGSKPHLSEKMSLSINHLPALLQHHHAFSLSWKGRPAESSTLISQDQNSFPTAVPIEYKNELQT